jgi:alginate O-acetyltransferase complex protein AlgI
MNYCFGIGIQKFIEKNKKRAKMIMTSAVCINILLLCVFKYASMLVPNLNIIMPIGISFYTFQGVSYLVDVYRGDAKAQNNIISFGTYIAMFPQLIAGPVVRYQTIEQQLVHRHDKQRIGGAQMANGIRRLIVGLGKKVILANNVGAIWAQILAMEQTHWNVCNTWIAVIAFTLQIYFDFSGYSDMAIGLAELFGFQLEENFNYPYQSNSITEFWRRWHISIGTWFREYVYIPLGGNKKGVWRHIGNIVIVWGLTGLWHGASINFLIWGLYYGLLLIIEKYLLNNILKKIPVIFTRLYTMLFVGFGWVLFEITDIGQLKLFVTAMFGRNGMGWQSEQTMYLIMKYSIMKYLTTTKHLITNLVTKILQTITRQTLWTIIQKQNYPITQILIQT